MEYILRLCDDHYCTAFASYKHLTVCLYFFYSYPANVLVHECSLKRGIGLALSQ